MTTRSMETVLQDLLAQRAWFEGLCRSLVADPATAADVAQETWLAALRRKLPLRRPQAWLTRVARNAARQQHRAGARRSAHEQRAAAARSGEVPDAADARERFEVQRNVAAAVHALREPFRTTVLLHWFEGLTLAAIAAQQDEPEGTVRWRLHRAHELLRERLQETYGDDWRAALLPLCGAGLRRSGSALALGAAAAVLLAGAGALWWSGGAAQGAGTPATARMATADAGSDPRAAVAAPAARTAAGAEGADPGLRPTDPPAATAADEEQRAIVRARLVGDDGAPIPGASLRLVGLEAGMFLMSSPLQALLVPPAEADADGNAALVLNTDPRLFEDTPAHLRPKPGDLWQLRFAAEARGHVRVERTWLVADGDDLDLGPIVLPAAAAVRGRVVDPQGSAITGAVVAAFAPPFGPERTPRDSAFGALAKTETASFFGRGSYALRGLPAGPLQVQAMAEGYTSAVRFVRLDAGETELPDLVLAPCPPPDRTERVQTVVVLDPSGAPVPNAAVYHRCSNGHGGMSRTFDDGRQRVPLGQVGSTAQMALCAVDPDSLFTPAWQPDTAIGAEPIVLRLTNGRIVEVVPQRDGAPLAGALVAWKAEAPALGEDYVTADADGRWRFAPPPFAARLVVRAKGHVPFESAPYLAGAWPERVAVDLTGVQPLTGAVTADGAPVAGADVVVLRHGAPRLQNGFRTDGWNGAPRFDAKTGADGRFAWHDDGAAEVRVLVRATGFAPSVSESVHYDPATGRSLPPIELARGGALTGRVTRRDGAPVPRAIVAANHPLFGAVTTVASADGVYAFAHLAAGEYEVSPTDERLGDDVSTTTVTDDAAAAPLPFDVAVRAGATAHLDLCVDAFAVRVEVAAAAGLALAGWRAALVQPHTGRWVGEPVPLVAGRAALRGFRRGPHRVELMAPGGPFGAVTVTVPCALDAEPATVRVDLDLRPWQGSLPWPVRPEAGRHVWFRQRTGDVEIVAAGVFDPTTGTADVALAPRGRVHVSQGGRKVGELTLAR
ncbi:MAG: sigma-70 family RNA polymerase sigma factor [Planctomycetota bacterium]